MLGIFSMCCLSPVYATDVNITDSNYIVYTTANLNVRTGPSLDCDKLGLFPAGTSVEVTGECSNGWMRVLYNEQEGYVSGKYVTSNQPVEETSVKMTIEREAGVSDSFYHSVENYYNKMSENVRNHMANDGWTIHICSGALNQRYGYPYSIAAITDYSSRQIWIDNRDVCASSILHESGHVIDYTLGNPSRSSEFAEIHAAEVETFANIRNTHKNHYDTSLEYFAEAFEMSLINPNSMQSHCPRTYEFVMRYANIM